VNRASFEELQFRVRNLLRRRGFEVVRTGLPEANVLGLHLDRLFDRLGINVVLDVGAGGGDFGRWVRRNGYTGRIASFEPVSDSFQRLAGHSAADPAWEPFKLALGSQDGDADINVSELRVFSSFLERSRYSMDEVGESAEVVRAETVRVRRLDGLAEQAFGGVVEPRVYLKMDTQGWDLEVLAGASGCLDTIVAFQSEVAVHPLYEGMPALQDSLARFEELGFGISGLFPVTLDSNLEVVEFDCVAVRHGAARGAGGLER
jgi:FkbM family methyltransferase